MRHPFSIEIKEGFGAFDHFVNVELREPKLSMRRVHSFKVLINSKKAEFFIIICMNISFSSFKTLYTIV
jgi:hypothetical protein